MGYIGTLSAKQKSNIDLLIETMNKKGLTNPFTQAGILAIISKESGFNPTPETGYGNTDNSRIRSKFSRARNLSNEELNQIKRDDKKFFNLVYGKRYGNDGYSSSWSGYKESWDLPYKDGNDGWRYRGRGFNQTTFKGNFRVLNKTTKHDIEKYPEKLENPKIASEVAIDYFLYHFNKSYSQSHQKHYNSKDIDGFKDATDSTLAMYHANAGFGKPMYNVDSAESSSGLKKALQRVPELLAYIMTSKAKKNIPLIILSLVLVAGLTVGAIFLFKSIKNKPK
jgi:predicted chitinase